MSRTIIRAWNKDGYHKDIAVLDVQQVRMAEGRVKESSGMPALTRPLGIKLMVNPKDFPEMTEFEIIVTEYQT